jgi:hypothetical protein
VFLAPEPQPQDVEQPGAVASVALAPASTLHPPLQKVTWLDSVCDTCSSSFLRPGLPLSLPGQVIVNGDVPATVQDSEGRLHVGNIDSRLARALALALIDSGQASVSVHASDGQRTWDCSERAELLRELAGCSGCAACGC